MFIDTSASATISSRPARSTMREESSREVGLLCFLSVFRNASDVSALLAEIRQAIRLSWALMLRHGPTTNKASFLPVASSVGAYSIHKSRPNKLS